MLLSSFPEVENMKMGSKLQFISCIIHAPTGKLTQRERATLHMVYKHKKPAGPEQVKIHWLSCEHRVVATLSPKIVKFSSF